MGNVIDNFIHSANKFVEDKIIHPIFGKDANISVHAGTSTDTMTPVEEQRLQTYNIMQNEGNMFGNTTAYNEEEKKESSIGDKLWDIGGQLLGGIAQTALSNYYNNQQQKAANKFNAEQAELNRQWQTQMANTAHQRELTDLLAAGLNPTMTGTGGGGAATTGGGQASATTPPYMNGTDISNTALTLAEAMKTINENKYISKEKKAQIANTVADTANKEAGTANINADTKKIDAETENAKQTLAKLKEETKTLKTNNDYNDSIGMADNSPQNLRFVAAMLVQSGIHEGLNPENKTVIEDAKDFTNWANKVGLHVIPKDKIELAYKTYKIMTGKK